MAHTHNITAFCLCFFIFDTKWGVNRETLFCFCFYFLDGHGAEFAGLELGTPGGVSPQQQNGAAKKNTENPLQK